MAKTTFNIKTTFLPAKITHILLLLQHVLANKSHPQETVDRK
jgi:hypothetical protein